MKKLSALISYAVLSGPACAALLQVPYNGGKQSGSIEISTHSGDLSSGQTSLNPDTIRIGPMTVRLYDEMEYYPAVCGFQIPAVALFDAPFGSVTQSADASGDWNSFGTIPETSVALDSATAWKGGSGGAVMLRGPGFIVFRSGQQGSCDGAKYSMESKWNRIVFLRAGSGVDYRAKISFQAKNDTTFGTLRYYQLLRSVTLHYVINATSEDLSGPVALRPERPERMGIRRNPKLEYELYNPLGVRLNRAPGSFEPAVQAPR